MNDPELLTGLSAEELEALADGLMAPSAQTRMHGLLGLRSEGSITSEEGRELDVLLKKADQLTILKTRARFTLNQSKAETADA